MPRKGTKGVACKPWQAWEDDIIRDNYPVLGRHMERLLPNRSIHGIRFRARKLGVEFVGEDCPERIRRNARLLSWPVCHV